MASDDEWTSPILAEVGPDGQVWMIDWYNFIVQHNPTPEGYKTGKGGAYETPLRDKTHGRIYRIVAKDGKPSAQPKLSMDDPKGLVAALKSDNMFWRLHAQRLLVERGKTDVKDDLSRDDRADKSRGRSGPVAGRRFMPRGSPHGLGVARGDRAEASVGEGGGHASLGRRAAERRCWRSRRTSRPRSIVKHELLEDGDPQVRLAALPAPWPMPARHGRGLAPWPRAHLRGRLDRDRWLTDAATAAAARTLGVPPKAIATSSPR